MKSEKNSWMIWKLLIPVAVFFLGLGFVTGLVFQPSFVEEKKVLDNYCSSQEEDTVFAAEMDNSLDMVNGTVYLKCKGTGVYPMSVGSVYSMEVNGN